MRATCRSCGEHSYWVDEQLAWPRPQFGSPPSDDLQGELRDLYEEARDVAARSPRSAAALLRLLVERLVTELGETEGQLFERIGRLAARGEITRRTVDALDAVRVAGNGAVHAGQIDPEGLDDHEAVLLLFSIVNTLIETAISLAEADAITPRPPPATRTISRLDTPRGYRFVP
jgi:hypothetical protein